MSNRSKMHDPWGHSAAYVQGAKERSRLSLRTNLRTTASSIIGSDTDAGSPTSYMSPAKRVEWQAERQQVIEQQGEPPMLGRSTSERKSVGNSEMMAALSLARHRSDGDISMQRKNNLVFEVDTRSDQSAGSTLNWGRRPVSLQDQIKEKVKPRLVLLLPTEPGLMNDDAWTGTHRCTPHRERILRMPLYPW
jgi:hypothetical protein